MVTIHPYKTLEEFYDSIDFDYFEGVLNVARLKTPVTLDYDGHIMEFDKGYTWNGSSLPGFNRWHINNPFDYLLASLFHDRAYETQPPWWSKRKIDSIYGEIMRQEGAPKWQANLRVWALWLFGSKVWNKCTQKIKDKNV